MEQGSTWHRFDPDAVPDAQKRGTALSFLTLQARLRCLLSGVRAALSPLPVLWSSRSPPVLLPPLSLPRLRAPPVARGLPGAFCLVPFGVFLRSLFSVPSPRPPCSPSAAPPSLPRPACLARAFGGVSCLARVPRLRRRHAADMPTWRPNMPHLLCNTRTELRSS